MSSVADVADHYESLMQEYYAMTADSSYNRDVLVEVKKDGNIDLRLVKISRLDVIEHFHYPDHRHLWGEIILCLEGNYNCILNGVELIVPAGHLVMVQPFDRHEDFYQAGSKLLFLIFELHDCAGQNWPHRIFSDGVSDTARIVAVNGDSSLEPLLRIIIAQNRNSQWQDAATEKLGEAFFWQLLSVIPAERFSSEFLGFMEQDWFRRQVADYFHEFSGSRLDVCGLADSLGMSKRALEYKFKQVFGTGPAQAFLAYKIRLASGMLERGMSVKEVALQLGFPEPFYFSTVFKRLTGKSPSQIRKSSNCAKS